MPRLLITGFRPFDGAEVNSSWLAVRRLAESWDGPAELHIAELPVEFGAAGAEITMRVDRLAPDVAIAVGLAGGRADVTLERVAINVKDGRIADNAGRQPIDEPIAPAGPAAYFSTLPIKACVAASRAAGVPAAVSNTAGTFVCNDVFYQLQAAAAGHPMRSGFVHVPQAMGYATGDEPSLPIEEIAVALRAIALTALTWRGADAQTIGGSDH